MRRQDLEGLTREQLIGHAERLGVARPRVLTLPELIDEIISRTTKGERERARARGWLGRARDLLARVVERGLHLPEAARVLRSPDDRSWPAPPPPLPTVTLAEIYAAQGHLERAIAVLDEVIAREPDHKEARSLRERFVEQAQRSRSRQRAAEQRSSDVVEEAAHAEEEAAAVEQDEEAGDEGDEEAAATAAVREGAGAGAGEPSAESSADSSAESSAIDAAAPEGMPPIVAPEAPRAAAATTEESTEEPATEPIAEAVAEPAAEAAVDDEAPLPDRYDVDEIVAIAVDPRTIYLYWEVRATTLAHAQARRPDGWLDVRVASVTASWDGPHVETIDLRVDALYGDRFLRDIRPGSNVRVSVGWKTADSFEPFAVGVEVTAPRAVPVEPVSQEIARWDAQAGAPLRGRRAAFLEGGPAVALHPPFFPGVAPSGDDDFAARVRVTASFAAFGAGRPADTGIALWPRNEDDALRAARGEDAWLEGPWYTPGGASELGRGGASELRRGGASELGRGR